MLSFSLFNTINWWNLKNVYNKFNFVCKKKVNWGQVMEFKLLWKRSNEVVIFRLVFSSRIQTSDKQLISCDFFLCSPQKQLSMSWETHNFKQKTLINQTVRSYHNRHRVNVRIRLLKKKAIYHYASGERWLFSRFFAVFSGVSLLLSALNIYPNIF